MSGRGERQRRLRAGDQAKGPAQPSVRRPTRPSRRRPRHGASYANTKGWAGVAGATVAGLAFVFIALRMYYDHWILQERGLVTTGDVVAVSYSRSGLNAVVRFTTADGKTVQADVSDTGDETEVEVGARMQIRYDPMDPTGRVEDANGGAGAFWLVGLGGVVLLAAAAYGATRVA
ncbi:DUF3592 domain-containing protein [Dactylosporangium sp. NPDC051484]|uniref:DUF3592 domain-containing protein n=1 Tax=Dactylosporangium sp. NPDC051484 TaxID=3154942 RepID=UPI00344FFB4A